MGHFNPSKDFTTKNNILKFGSYVFYYYICKQKLGIL